MKSHQDIDNYEFVGHEKNDGFYTFQAPLVATKDILEVLGVNTVLSMRRRIFEILGYKEMVYGRDSIDNEDTISLPEEVFFQDKITGSIVSFTHTEIDDVLNQSNDFVYIAKGYHGEIGLDYDPNYPDDVVNPPVFLKDIQLDKRDEALEYSEHQVVVSFRPDIDIKL